MADKIYCVYDNLNMQTIEINTYAHCKQTERFYNKFDDSYYIGNHIRYGICKLETFNDYIHKAQELDITPNKIREWNDLAKKEFLLKQKYGDYGTQQKFI